MSAILHSFQIQLTEDQAAAIRIEWLKVAQADAAMLVIQPVGMTVSHGIIGSSSSVLNCAILDQPLAQAINDEIVTHKKLRTA